MALPKTYEPQKYEDDIYRLWEESGAFAPKGKGKPFCILMPPPNANADLHLGHALTIGIEDIMVRYARLRGRNTLYLPGADHAGFETQVVYERHLEKEGKSRFDYSRDELYEQIYRFVQANRGNMEHQVKRLGASCDWSRNTFTLDDRIIERTYATFKKMWDEGLIYRSERIVNYCTHHDTSFSDLEVEYKDEPSKLWHIKYPVEKGGGEIIVATARPETMLGDTAVAVHPDDSRYQDLIGKVVDLPLVGRPIPVIADKAVEQEFGTGAVKVTPAHDSNDFEIGERHELPRVQVIGFDGKITEEAPESYRGLDVSAARAKVVEDLKRGGWLVKEEPHDHRVGVCYKCGTTIEPLLKEQWLIDMKPLAKPAIAAIESDQIKIVPRAQRKVLLRWLTNIRDWNISRQIAWGIPVPAFQNVDNPDDWIFDNRVSSKTIEVDGATYHRDPDVFDTWFSSGQWPFATLGYPGGDDFKQFYPTAVMETAGEILFFWVARMIMLSLYITGEVPFKTVYLHGLLLDEQGTKMSKSRGNVINPIEVSDEYGSDALRLGLIAGRSPGLNQSFDYAKVVGGRNFANKLWNVARFILNSSQGQSVTDAPKPRSIADEWLLTRLAETTRAVTDQLENFRFSEAAQTVTSLLWDDFADWYLEASKDKPNHELLLFGLTTILRLAHPFVPFVTEAIWQELKESFGTQPLGSDQLITATWPEPAKTHPKGAAAFGRLQELVTEIRNIQGELDLDDVVLYHHDNRTLLDHGGLVAQLTQLAGVKAVDEGQGLPLFSVADAWLGVDHATIKEYIASLKRQQLEIEQQQATLKSRLDNQDYVAKAPKELVADTKQKYQAGEKRLDAVTKQIEQLIKIV